MEIKQHFQAHKELKITELRVHMMVIREAQEKQSDNRSGRPGMAGK